MAAPAHGLARAVRPRAVARAADRLALRLTLLLALRAVARAADRWQNSTLAKSRPFPASRVRQPVQP